MHMDMYVYISVVPIIGSAIGNSRLLGNFVTIGIGRFLGYNIGLLTSNNFIHSAYN